MENGYGPNDGQMDMVVSGRNNPRVTRVNNNDQHNTEIQTKPSSSTSSSTFSSSSSASHSQSSSATTYGVDDMAKKPSHKNKESNKLSNGEIRTTSKPTGTDNEWYKLESGNAENHLHTTTGNISRTQNNAKETRPNKPSLTPCLPIICRECEPCDCLPLYCAECPPLPPPPTCPRPKRCPPLSLPPRPTCPPPPTAKPCPPPPPSPTCPPPPTCPTLPPPSTCPPPPTIPPCATPSQPSTSPSPSSYLVQNAKEEEEINQGKIFLLITLFSSLHIVVILWFIDLPVNKPYINTFNLIYYGLLSVRSISN